MTLKKLVSPTDAIADIAAVFGSANSCTIEVREERAFEEGKFLPLGEIRIFPQEGGALEQCSAVRYGAFEWRTPDAQSTKKTLTRSVSQEQGADSKRDDRLRRVMSVFGAIPARLGLSHPVFDPYALAAMPFGRPTTVVSDTSGILQGGLTFVAAHLYPQARVKIPAIVHMEIVNQTDRFLKLRRASRVRPWEILWAHLNSQGGHRVLLNLEMRSDIELERTFLLGDPLRDAFREERGTELSHLNISVSVKSYVDRLVLEAARQHQSRAASGHSVLLLTADQGLARMSLAEGIHPLYFRPVGTDAFLGQCFTGATLGPFSGTLRTVSVAEVLWELATVFGQAKLRSSDGARSLTVHAIGEELPWVPYHTRDDLLWTEIAGEAVPERQTPRGGTAGRAPGGSSEERRERTRSRESSPRRPTVGRQGSRVRMPLYKMSLARLFALVDTLESMQELPVSAVREALGIRSPRALKDYQRFLESGSAVSTSEDRWVASEGLAELAIALRTADPDEVRRSLRRFPSFSGLEKLLCQHSIGVPVALEAFGRARSTFVALAEVTGLGATVFGSGFFATPSLPVEEDFARMAVSSYERLEKGTGWVSTGRWLEELIMAEGIHPTVSRVRLQLASERGLLSRATEGSTTQTDFDRHSLRVLDVRDGRPFVRTEHLYRGDFLIPGKASSSLRIGQVAS